ncbi:MAG: hypothetical protein DRP86_05175 [Candidatus Neomarinimicrobiota bacterium]|nr:MAG: hypothetical protein DRP86_05175 [Candidatus Neomarinimicrobiota bacterium]
MTNNYAHFERNRRFVETGVFLALFWGLAYAFLYVPNVEFILFIAFLSGFLLGWIRGVFVALLGELVFSVANPMGSGLAYPPMLMAQLLGFGIVASAGFGLRPVVRNIRTEKKMLIFLFGAAGLVLTFVYDSLTSLAFPLASGFTGPQIWVTYLSGLPFYAIHILSNTLIFAILGPILIQIVTKKYTHYLDS